jgi:Tfp pilus assembly protein PilW
MSTASASFNVDLHNPFASKQTMMVTQYGVTDLGSVWGAGTQQSTTSFTDFTLTTGAGTITGGTIYIYGYGAS